MAKTKSKTFDIWVKCPRCGKVGKLMVRVRHNSKMCFIRHFEGDVVVTHAVSCLDIEKQGINVDELVRIMKLCVEW